MIKTTEPHLCTHLHVICLCRPMHLDAPPVCSCAFFFLLSLILFSYNWKHVSPGADSIGNKDLWTLQSFTLFLINIMDKTHFIEQSCTSHLHVNWASGMGMLQGNKAKRECSTCSCNSSSSATHSINCNLKKSADEG